MKKNKNGSTLITTVIILMFITTVSLGMLSMVSTNYYGRVGESKRTQNLYGSESGLDTTYNIINKTVTAANYYGNKKVEDMKKVATDLHEESDKEATYSKFNRLGDQDQKLLYALYEDIDYWKYYNGNLKKNQNPIPQATIDTHVADDNKAIYNLTNKVFKDGFEEFIKNNLNTSISGSSYIELTMNDTTKQMESKVQTLDKANANVYLGHYPGKNPTQEQLSKLTNEVENMMNNPASGTAFNVFDSQSVTLNVEAGYDYTVENDEVVGRIKYEPYEIKDVTAFAFNNREYGITVTSEFQTSSTNENTAKVGTNLKVIEANYSIRVPDYDEIALKNSVVNVDTKPNQMISSLAIGGDFDVQNVNQLIVNGDIFVQGDTSKNTDTDNGILNKFSGGIKLNNDGSTQKTIKFNDNVYTRGTFNVKNNINVYVNGDLYAKNIYAGNGNESSNNSQLQAFKDVVVDNDLTLNATNTAINLYDFYGINDKNSGKDTDLSTKVRNSSSIIVNNYTKDTENKYGIKIIDNAYIMGVAHINTENGYPTGESVAVKGNYKAYSVPDSSGTETFVYDNPLQVLQADTVDAKAKHFVDYWNKNSGVDYGGVWLNPNKIYSIGSSVNLNGNAVKVASQVDQNKENTIVDKRINYARNIYTISKNNSYTDDALKIKYTQMGGTDVETVKGFLTKLEDYNLSNKPNDGNGFAMFSTSDSKNIVIKGKGINSTGTYSDNDIIIDAQSTKDVKAVIITNGNVIIDGDVNFRGNIIAAGNLKVLGNSTVNLAYDEYVTQDIQSNNKDEFNKVFGNFGEEKIEDSGLTINSNSTDFIKNKLWKVIQ